MASDGNIGVVLPEAIRQLAEVRVSVGDYPTVSDYLCDLVRADQQRREWLDGELLAALDGGETTEVTDADWDEIRAEVHRRLQAKGSR